MGKNIASHNFNASLGTLAQFLTVMEEAGVSLEFLKLPINSKTARRNLAEYLNMGCPRIKNGQAAVTTANNYDRARNILGKDFISPGEVALAKELAYSDETLTHFSKTLPSKEVLYWLRDNGFVLMAGPPNKMSLLRLRNLNPFLFYSKSGGWYVSNDQKFSRNDEVNACWLMLSKSVVQNSTSKTWGEQQRLIAEEEYIPNAPEICWVITTYKEVHDVWLFPKIYVRTSSVNSNGCNVVIGRSVSGGIDVYSRCGDYCSRNLALSSAKKRNFDS